MKRKAGDCKDRIKAYRSTYDDMCKNVKGLEPRLNRMKSYKGIDISGKSGIIKEKNISILRSVGASGRNYPVKLPNGNHSKFAEGTEITKVKVFAGKGTKIPIREAIALENNYGIPAEEWQKVRGEGVVIFTKRKIELQKYIGMRQTVKKKK